MAYFVLRMEPLLILEIFGAVTALVFLVLMIKQNIWCWPIGILSSLCSIYLFFYSKLYMESFLYLFYVGVGLYGWLKWHQGRQNENVGLPIIASGWSFHLISMSICLVLSIGCSWLFKTYTDAERTFIDATTTMYSLLASYMEAHKMLSSWLLWIVINFISIFLYLDRGLKFYAGQMVVFFLLSIAGWLQWKKEYAKQEVKA